MWRGNEKLLLKPLFQKATETLTRRSLSPEQIKTDNAASELPDEEILGSCKMRIEELRIWGRECS